MLSYQKCHLNIRYTVPNNCSTIVPPGGVTGVYGVLPRHERAPARAADGVDVVVVEDEARVGQRVDVGGGDLV